MHILTARLLQEQAQNIQLGLSMILSLHLTNYIWPEEKPLAETRFEYDYIIVGCGTAGSILANRLTEDHRFNVLVIEAGGDPPLESLYPKTTVYLRNSAYDWNYTSVNDVYTAQSHRGKHLHLTSGKMLGGSSSLGDHIYDRGDPSIYDEWANITLDDSWSYEELLPYFERVENLEFPVNQQSHENIPVTKLHIGLRKRHKQIANKYLKAFESAEQFKNVALSRSKTLGYYEPVYMIRDGIRQSAAYAYLHPIKDRRNLHVLKHAEVVGIKFESKVATGVTVVRKGNSYKKLKAKNEIIISAGALKTPQLLMLSGIGPTDYLEGNNIATLNDIPVGKNFQDHLGVILVHKLKYKNRPFSMSNNPHDIPLPIIIGNAALNNSINQYRSLNYIISDSLQLLQLCSIQFSFEYHICESFYNQTNGYETLVTIIILPNPKSRGNVLLQSKDTSEAPAILSGFVINPSDLKDTISYIQDFLRTVRSQPFKVLGPKLIFPKLKQCKSETRSSYWECYARHMVTTTYDYSGTCAMGSVVDNKLKVKNMENIRVVDASVMPVIPSSNIQAAVMAIAEKAADMILGDVTMQGDELLL